MFLQALPLVSRTAQKLHRQAFGLQL